MKKYTVILCFLCLAMFSCKETPKPIMTIDQVYDSWQTTVIKGVKNADVMDMVKAFHKQWPTQSVAAFLEDIQLPEEQRQYLSNYVQEDGYVFFAEGSDDPDSESMEARVWQRTNGHQLLGIAFFQRSAEVKSFIAFFDYDPSAKTLTPDVNAAKPYVSSFANTEVGYSLSPEDDYIVANEYFFNWWSVLRHIYSWDGMNFTDPETEFYDVADIMDEFDRDYMTYEMGEFSKYALIDIDEDGEPELWLSTDDEEYQAVLSIVEGKVTIIAGKDFKRQLIFYKSVVGDAGGCGTGCYYTHYTKLKNSAPEYDFSDLTTYVFETDGVEDEYAKDGELLTEEEAEEILNSFGEPYDPQVEWRPLRLTDI